MKKTTFIFFIFFIQNIFSQEFKFDNYIEYRAENHVVFLMTNTKDSSYIFIGRIYGYVKEGCIRDIKNKKNHRFLLKNGDINLTFQYLTSVKWDLKNIDYREKNVDYNYKFEEIDSSKTLISIERNKIKRKKIFTSKIKLSYDKTKEFYLPVNNDFFRFFEIHFFDSRKIELDERKLPISIEITNTSGYKSIFNTKNKKINTTLTISEEELNYSE